MVVQGQAMGWMNGASLGAGAGPCTDARSSARSRWSRTRAACGTCPGPAGAGTTCNAVSWTDPRSDLWPGPAGAGTTCSAILTQPEQAQGAAYGPRQVQAWALHVQALSTCCLWQVAQLKTQGQQQGGRLDDGAPQASSAPPPSYNAILF